MKLSGILCALALPVALLSSPLASAKEFRAADNQPLDYPSAMAMKFIGSQLSKATNGKYDVKVFGNSTLGSAKDAIEQVKIGALAMTRVSTSDFHSIVPATLVPSFPFIFRNLDHFRKVMYGPIGDDILKQFEKAGFIGLCFYEDGARSIYAKKPVRNLADVKGMKIRVQPSDLWVGIVAAMGATATPIPYAEVYTAIKTGLVDAAENNFPSYETQKHYESAPVFSETEHVMAPAVVVFSKKIFDTLPAEDQAAIRKAGRESVAYYVDLWSKKEDAARAAVKAAGTTIVSDVNKPEFVTAMKPVWDKYATTPELKALTQKIVDTK
ncbi:TRAP transporter substrate-binding protein [Xanthobacteraceae bacterium Astr-EGSB]|uniref:TRAP transporter substrate-binding protein n=1 Tax=Astrobacterium formosum TaxID=3069710 RepID=UPI0027B5FF2E|nr:TRAP transporter substrate-binding protein [Xanthobacteraceae bacterium Astr-EGSB]